MLPLGLSWANGDGLATLHQHGNFSGHWDRKLASQNVGIAGALVLVLSDLSSFQQKNSWVSGPPGIGTPVFFLSDLFLW